MVKTTFLANMFMLIAMVGIAHAIRLHAAFASHEAHTLFSDRFASNTRAHFAIPIREEDLGVLVAHDNERVDVFCHSNYCIYQCLWDTKFATNSLQKMNTLRALKEWHKIRSTNETLTLHTIDSEDLWAWQQI